MSMAAIAVLLLFAVLLLAVRIIAEKERHARACAKCMRRAAPDRAASACTRHLSPHRTAIERLKGKEAARGRH